MMANPRGFTLLEVIIAMMIMAFLSLFTVEAIQRALKTKTKVQKEIDKNATLRDALRIMERDINMAFNYRDINLELHNQTQDARQKKSKKAYVPDSKLSAEENAKKKAEHEAAQAAASTSDGERFKKKEEKIATQFIGESEAIDFTSLSNIRMSEEQKISSQAEIGYKIKSCRRRSTQEQSSKCLWRRVSNYIHEDITKAGEETVLLENVTEFKLRYLGPGKDDEWVDQWITSDKGGDDTTKNKFPYAVEITLAVKDTTTDAKDKVLRMTAVAAIRNPNNKKEAPKTDGQPGTVEEPPPGS